jgi:hypothetical protein
MIPAAAGYPKIPEFHPTILWLSKNCAMNNQPGPTLADFWWFPIIFPPPWPSVPTPLLDQRLAEVAAFACSFAFSTWDTGA